MNPQDIADIIRLQDEIRPYAEQVIKGVNQIIEGARGLIAVYQRERSGNPLAAVSNNGRADEEDCGCGG